MTNGPKSNAVSRQASAVSPALWKYEDEVLVRRVWARPGLSRRDRSIVTLAALITRGQTLLLPLCASQALDHGVMPKELSEIVTHLAFYAGWGNAVAAAASIEGVFVERAVGVDQLPPASPDLMPIDEAAEDRRAHMVDEMLGGAAPHLAEDTAAILFRDLWLRPDLAPRDRSMVTAASLIAGGQFPQLSFHLGKAMDGGLTSVEASEMVSHLAYYAGWPNAMSAAEVLKSVFERREK